MPKSSALSACSIDVIRRDCYLILCMKKVHIIGSSGAGKSTLAAALAKQLDVPHIQIDALNWEPGWVQVPDKVLRQRVQDAIKKPAWVIDGNYAKVRDLIWPQIDTLIWLDYSLPLVMWRQLRRAAKRVVWREECCNGNYETLRHTLSRDAAWYWALTTHQHRKREMRERLSQVEATRFRVLHFQSPRAAARWLQKQHANSGK
jgi:adenylate kinase family enzyme